MLIADVVSIASGGEHGNRVSENALGFAYLRNTLARYVAELLPAARRPKAPTTFSFSKTIRS